MAIFLWLYTIFLVVIWGFFIIAKIHAYKFINFSNYIEVVTRTLLVLLLILSALWYALIFYMHTWWRTINLGTNINNWSDLYFNEVNY